ncbi:MAG: bifunctional homocysteine S-methyltransferase/methylenetetrahydrofolate reductase [Spirochaetia bacterium]
MKKPYLDRLSDGVLLFDGAMGTMLYSKGVFVNKCFEEVCLSRPDLIEEIHNEYIDAGAQAIEANTYGANPVKLAAFGLDERTEEINKAAMGIAKSCAGESIYVAASVGSLGKRVAPYGPVSQEEAITAYQRQIGALLEEGPDLLLFETFRDIDELVLSIETARELSSEIPIQAQFTLGRLSSAEYETEAPKIAKRLDEHPAVNVVGVNCSVGPADTLEMLIAMYGYVEKPIAIMPNAGFPKEVEDRILYLASPEYFAEYAKRFLESGANIIGGCCGTTPEHIRKMGHAVLSLDIGTRSKVLKSAFKDVEEKEELPLEDRSRLGSKLVKGDWITSVELVPPLGADLSKVLDKTRQVSQAGIDCINIPDGPRASSRVSPMVTAIEMERTCGIETVLHVCCRDKNLISLQADLLGAQAMGLRNMLLITGDPPKVGRYPDVSGVFDVDSIGLISLAKRMNRGIDIGGNQLPAPTSFVLGAGVNPAAPLLEREIDRAFKKAEAGAEFFITQPVFDAQALIDFLEKISDTGLPIIAGVWPLASYKNALFLNNEVPGVVISEEIMERMHIQETKEDARQEGIAIAREIVESIRTKIQGVQVSPPFGRVKTALEVLR